MSEQLRRVVYLGMLPWKILWKHGGFPNIQKLVVQEASQEADIFHLEPIFPQSNRASEPVS